MVALRVRMRHTLANPPYFSQLMGNIREEESWINAREGVKTAATAVTTTVPQSPVTSHIRARQPKNEVKALSSQVARLLNAAPVATKPGNMTAKNGSKQPASEATTLDTLARGRAPRSTPPGIFCYQCGQDGQSARDPRT